MGNSLGPHHWRERGWNVCMGPGLSHLSVLLPLEWMARSCHPRAGGSPNPSIVTFSQCLQTPRTLGQPVDPEMAWWALFRAVENLLGR